MLLNEIAHYAHMRRGMVEKSAVSAANRTLSISATVLRAVAVAKTQQRTRLTFRAQRGSLGLTKLRSPRAGIELTQRGVMNITQAIIRVDIVIALIQIAIRFQGKSMPAGGA